MPYESSVILAELYRSVCIGLPASLLWSCGGGGKNTADKKPPTVTISYPQVNYSPFILDFAHSRYGQELLYSISKKCLYRLRKRKQYEEKPGTIVQSCRAATVNQERTRRIYWQLLTHSGKLRQRDRMKHAVLLGILWVVEAVNRERDHRIKYVVTGKNYYYLHLKKCLWRRFLWNRYHRNWES